MNYQVYQVLFFAVPAAALIAFVVVLIRQILLKRKLRQAREDEGRLPDVDRLVRRLERRDLIQKIVLIVLGCIGGAFLLAVIAVVVFMTLAVASM